MSTRDIKIVLDGICGGEVRKGEKGREEGRYGDGGKVRGERGDGRGEEKRNEEGKEGVWRS